MIPPAGRILKSSQVDVEGRFTLDLENHVQQGHNIKNAPANIAKVRILENQNEYAVMEVTCSCGRKTVIRCDYGGAAAVKNSQSSPQQAKT
jgi:16S rRNA U516 pseudouridylate synthase RsuA-like enzyme